MTVALVYQDYVHSNGVLLKRLQGTSEISTIRFVDAADIQNGVLQKYNNALFIMPGGADLFYCEKLNGAGNAAIRSFVESGGIYLGLCAGAYYGCAGLNWAEHEEHPITGTRELAFINTVATGPVYDLIEDGDFNKSWSGIAHVEMDGTTYPAYYEGGPVFDTPEALGRYTLPGNPPAIVQQSIGKGLVILSSPHIEYTPAYLEAALYKHRQKSPDYMQGLLSTFKQHWRPELDLWSKIISPHLKH